VKKEPGFLIAALLHFAADAIDRQVHEGFLAAGITDIRPAHEIVFGVLSPEGDRVVDLAQRARMTKQAMGYLVIYLEERGYLERTTDPKDGRAQIVRRTEKGWEVNRLAKQLVQQVQDEWAEQLGQESMNQLIGLLRELVTIIGVQYQGSVSEITSRPK
jgi:DNA-binding MarR family transcriptional regulator